jgi:acyl-CoA synthetase (NDP forming)
MTVPQESLSALLRPRSVAVVGASLRAETVGNFVLNIVAGPRYGGTLCGVNPRYDEIDGYPCYASVADIPETPDCVVLAVNDARVEQALTAAAAAGVRGAVIFGRCYEAEPATPPLHARLAAIAREAGMAVCGGNCMGLLNRVDDVHLCMTRLPETDTPGNVGLLSHSGSTWSGIGGNQRQLDISYGVSTGTEIAGTMADYIRFMVRQPETRAIGCVMETIREPEAFLAAVQEAESRGIAIVALKLGRTDKSRAFAFSHSGALTGSDAAYDAVFERHNVVRTRTLDEMLDTLELMTCDRAPTGDAVGVQTDSGGERQLIVDLAGDIGLKLAELTQTTKNRLSETLDPGLDADNPVDYWGESGMEVLPKITRILADDDTVGVVTMATNMVPGRPILYGSTQAIEAAHAATGKPCLMLANLNSSVDPAEAARLRRIGIPVLLGTETGLRAIDHFIAWHGRRGRTPGAPPKPPPAETVALWRERLIAAPLEPDAAMSMISDFGVPVPESATVDDCAAAVAAAGQIGYPVVLKTADPSIQHKSDLGGVVIGLDGPDAVASAYQEISEALGPQVLVQAQAPRGTEVLVGMVDDAQFGPVMTVGLGGVFVEVFGDAITFLPPIDPDHARGYLERLAGYAALTGARGRPAADLPALSEAIARLSVLAVTLGGLIAEMDVNPIVAHEDGAIAVDALIVPHKKEE